MDRVKVSCSLTCVHNLWSSLVLVKSGLGGSDIDIMTRLGIAMFHGGYYIIEQI
jgi:hypothetical protein